MKVVNGRRGRLAVALETISSGGGLIYVRLRAEFVYVAVILNGFSRKVVGRMDATLAARLATDALLGMAPGG